MHLDVSIDVCVVAWISINSKNRVWARVECSPSCNCVVCNILDEEGNRKTTAKRYAKMNTVSCTPAHDSALHSTFGCWSVLAMLAWCVNYSCARLWSTRVVRTIQIAFADTYVPVGHRLTGPGSLTIQAQLALCDPQMEYLLLGMGKAMHNITPLPQRRSPHGASFQDKCRRGLRRCAGD